LPDNLIHFLRRSPATRPAPRKRSLKVSSNLLEHIRDRAVSTGKSLGQTVTAMTEMTHPITLTLVSVQSETSPFGHAMATARCASEIVVKLGIQYYSRAAESKDSAQTVNSDRADDDLFVV
jgi:hypothetical protein